MFHDFDDLLLIFVCFLFAGGVHLIEPNPAELVRLVEEGNEFIAYSLDIRMVDVSCRTGLAEIKKVRK